MTQGLEIALITLGGVACMGGIAFIVIKTLINTTKYKNKKNDRE